MLKYHIWTIGCQMNRAESERLGSYLEEMDYQPADNAEDADLIVLNSCVVRQSAENRVTNRLSILKSLKRSHPGKTLAVTGCMVNSDTAGLKDRFPHVDHFFKPGDIPPSLTREKSAMVLPRQPSPSAFVPIIQGCNNFCSYCIVPYRRGRERSRPPSAILDEVREMLRRGAKEVVLLGQNVDSYGQDLPEKPDLAGLLDELNAVDGLARIRFLTNHPKDMSLKLIRAIASLNKVCEHLNLPAQSGSNEILKAMKRGYTAEQYRELIARIRGEIPGVALSTDIIAGFPSESAYNFQQTVDLLSEIKFDTVHIAAYSPRAGTTAARDLVDDVPLKEKKERVNIIEGIQENIVAEINSKLLGRTVEILVEGKEKDKWRGRTRTDKLVFFSSDSDYLGKLVNIRVNKTGPWSLQGEAEPDKAN